MAYDARGKVCLLCGENPSVYENVRHCKKCHLEYCKANAKLHKRKRIKNEKIT